MVSLAVFRFERKSENYVFWAVMVMLVFMAGFRGEGVDRDYENYVSYMQTIDNLSIEPTFLLISSIALMLNNQVVVFLIYAFFGVSLKFIAINKITNLRLLSILFYFSFFFPLHELTQIRAGVASALLLLAIKPIYERKFFQFVILSLLAISFHYAAIFMLPLWFLQTRNVNKFFLVVVPVGALFLYLVGIQLGASAPIPIPALQSKIDIYNQLTELGVSDYDQINVFNLVYLGRLAIYYFILFFVNSIQKKNIYVVLLLNIYMLSLAAFPLFSALPVVAFRVTEFYGIVEVVLFPLIVYTIKQQNFARALVSVVPAVFMFTTLFYARLIN
jgi:hypothetical protein